MVGISIEIERSTGTGTLKAESHAWSKLDSNERAWAAGNSGPCVRKSSSFFQIAVSQHQSRKAPGILDLSLCQDSIDFDGELADVYSISSLRS